MFYHVFTYAKFVIAYEAEVTTLIKHAGWLRKSGFIAMKYEMAFNSCWPEADSEEVWEIKRPCFPSFVCH